MAAARAPRGLWGALLAGLVVAVLVAGLGPLAIDTRPPPPDAWEEAAAQGAVWVFPPNGTGGSLLLWAPYGPQRALEGLRSGPGALEPSALAWPTARLAVHEAPRRDCPCAGDAAAVRVTAYVFAEDRLLASNAPAELVARFRPHGQYLTLPDHHWALREPAPAGAVRLGSEWQPLLRQAAPALASLAVGDAMVLRVAEHPHVGSVGPLVVTLRLDAVAPAGPP